MLYILYRYPSTRMCSFHVDLAWFQAIPASSLHTVSNQKLEAGTAWEWGSNQLIPKYTSHVPSPYLISDWSGNEARWMSKNYNTAYQIWSCEAQAILVVKDHLPLLFTLILPSPFPLLCLFPSSHLCIKIFVRIVTISHQFVCILNTLEHLTSAVN